MHNDFRCTAVIKKQIEKPALLASKVEMKLARDDHGDIKMARLEKNGRIRLW